MKYTGEYLVTFAEVPDEITLCINISGCPYHCPGCHSPWLQEDTGKELTLDVIQDLISRNEGITCICFMGGSEESIVDLLGQVNLNDIKKAWYTGQDYLPDYRALVLLDYVKVGPYKQELGPLTSKTTNQRLYQIYHHNVNGVVHNSIKDITSRFWKD